MHPILLRFGPLTLHSYGVLVASAFLAAIMWARHEASLRHLNREKVYSIALWVMLGAILGARILYILIDLPYFTRNPLRIFSFWEGGLVFSGGLSLACLFGYRVIRNDSRKLEWCDTLAPALALGQGIGRVGCFMAGCCYGAETHAPWAVIFSAPNGLAPIGVPLHPTQLYQSLAGFVLFGALILFRRKGLEPGKIAGLYLVLFSLFRIGIEFFRADWRGDFGFASVTQVVTGFFLLLGLFLVMRNNRSSAHA